MSHLCFRVVQHVDRRCIVVGVVQGDGLTSVSDIGQIDDLPFCEGNGQQCKWDGCSTVAVASIYADSPGLF